jgi:DNA-binding winged helix-turn-helix (wHTH) protein/tetratricopeptide (TPR) repeat protein
MHTHIWRFGSFELDPEHRSLTRDGQVVALTPKAFDVLVLLVARHGRLVAKDEMLKTLWPDSFVEEGNLSVHVSMLRKRLGESTEDHRFIVTVPGRGYQFVAEVVEDSRAPAPDATTMRPTIVWRRERPPSQLRWWLASAGCSVVVALGIWAVWSARPPAAPAGARVQADTRDPEVDRLYQRGRYLLGKRTAESLRRGIAHFQSAVALDAEFALAHSGLADAYSMLGYFGFEAPLQVLPRAQAAAARALALAPASAAAHTSRAYILHRYEWRFADAERSFQRAIALQPDYALARHWYGSFLESMNRHDEAIAQSARAEELEPVSAVISANLAGILNSARHGSRAMAQWDKALELDNAFWGAHLTLAEIYAGRDMPEQALDAFRQSIALSGDNPRQIAALARYHAASGRRRDAREILDKLERRAQREWVSPADIASVHAALGEPDEAFAWLDRAVEHRDPLIAYLAESSMWRPVRRDPRYAALLRRLGFDGIASITSDRAGGT